MSYHQITAVGHLGADPETKTGNSGDFVVFPLAVNDRDETRWYEVLAFGKQGETVQRFKKKGDQILVTGAPSLDVYKTKDGEAAGRIKIFAHNVTFLSSQKTSESREPVGAGAGSDGVPF